MYCKECGRELGENLICSNCGNNQGPVVKKGIQKKHLLRTIMIIAVLAVVFGTGTAIIVSNLNQSGASSHKSRSSRSRDDDEKRNEDVSSGNIFGSLGREDSVETESNPSSNSNLSNDGLAQGLGISAQYVGNSQVMMTAENNRIYYISSDGRWVTEMNNFVFLSDGEIYQQYMPFINTTFGLSEYPGWLGTIMYNDTLKFSLGLTDDVVQGMTYDLSNAGAIGTGDIVSLNISDESVIDPNSYFGFCYEVNTWNDLDETYDRLFTDFEITIDVMDWQSGIFGAYVNYTAPMFNGSSNIVEGYFIAEIPTNTATTYDIDLSFDTYDLPDYDLDTYDYSSSSSTSCVACHGSTYCSICGGTGTYSLYGQSSDCSACSGSGECSICNGTGVN